MQAIQPSWPPKCNVNSASMVFKLVWIWVLCLVVREYLWKELMAWSFNVLVNAPRLSYPRVINNSHCPWRTRPLNFQTTRQQHFADLISWKEGSLAEMVSSTTNTTWNLWRNWLRMDTLKVCQRYPTQTIHPMIKVERSRTFGTFHTMEFVTQKSPTRFAILKISLLFPYHVLTIVKIALAIVVQYSGTTYPQLLGKQHLWLISHDC